MLFEVKELVRSRALQKAVRFKAAPNNSVNKFSVFKNLKPKTTPKHVKIEFRLTELFSAVRFFNSMDRIV